MKEGDKEGEMKKIHERKVGRKEDRKEGTEGRETKELHDGIREGKENAKKGSERMGRVKGRKGVWREGREGKTEGW